MATAAREAAGAAVCWRPASTSAAVYRTTAIPCTTTVSGTAAIPGTAATSYTATISCTTTVSSTAATSCTATISYTTTTPFTTATSRTTTISRTTTVSCTTIPGRTATTTALPRGIPAVHDRTATNHCFTATKCGSTTTTTSSPRLLSFSFGLAWRDGSRDSTARSLLEHLHSCASVFAGRDSAARGTSAGGRLRR